MPGWNFCGGAMRCCPVYSWGLTMLLVVASIWAVNRISEPGPAGVAGFAPDLLSNAALQPAGAQQSTSLPHEDRAADRLELQGILDKQAACWNAGDIPGFMATYWNSDEMTFSSGGRLVRGWDNALKRYQQNYPVDSMGQLSFGIEEIRFLAGDVAMLLGNYHLEKPLQNSGAGQAASQQEEANRSRGNFTLILKKLDPGWRIIHDHSSAMDLTATSRQNENLPESATAGKKSGNISDR